MTNDERLNLRARQLLDDPTLPQNQRIKNADALMKALATVPDRLALLNEITDLAIRAQMDAALSAIG